MIPAARDSGYNRSSPRPHSNGLTLCTANKVVWSVESSSAASRSSGASASITNVGELRLFRPSEASHVWNLSFHHHCHVPCTIHTKYRIGDGSILRCHPRGFFCRLQLDNLEGAWVKFSSPAKHWDSYTFMYRRPTSEHSGTKLTTTGTTQAMCQSQITRTRGGSRYLGLLGSSISLQANAREPSTTWHRE